jgi:hypothetical protein
MGKEHESSLSEPIKCLARVLYKKPNPVEKKLDSGLLAVHNFGP